MFTQVAPPDSGLPNLPGADLKSLAVRPAGADRVLVLGARLYRGGPTGAFHPVERVAPEPFPGSLLVSPLDPGRVWYLTEDGSVHRSDDGGLSFARVTRIECLSAAQVDAEDPDRLLVLSSAGAGSFWQTRDAGRTWTSRALTPPDGAPSWTRLFVLPGGRLVAIAVTPQALESTDEGVTWGPRDPEVPGHFTQSFSFSRTQPSWLYALASGALARSTDGGATFQATGTAFPGFDAPLVDQRDAKVLYVVDATLGIQRSTDAGVSFQPLGLPEGSAVSAIVQDPALPESFYALTAQGLLVSQDGGQSFHALPVPDPVPFFSVRADPFRQNLHGYVVDVGLRSTDGGQSWAARATPPLSLTFDPAVRDRVLGVSLGSTSLSTDGGETFHAVLTAAGPLAYDATDPNVVVMVRRDLSAIWRSTDSGTSWEELGTSVSRTVRVSTPLVSAPGSLYVGVLEELAPYFPPGVARSTDGGLSWRFPEVGPGIVPGLLTVRPGHPETLFATEADSLLQSTDSGRSWTEIWRPLGGIQALAFTPGSEDELFVAQGDGGYPVCTPVPHRLYRSTDAGRTFVPAGLSGALVNGLSFLPGSPRTVVAAAGYAGLFGMSGRLVFGDADANGGVDVQDMVILANEIVGNVGVGATPFLAPEEAMDANLDDVLDVADLVLLSGFVVGNVPSLPVSPIRTALDALPR